MANSNGLRLMVGSALALILTAGGAQAQQSDVTSAAGGKVLLAALADQTQQGGAIATVGGGSAAQPASASGAASGGEIVITGTLVRGIAPVGSNVVGISQADIQSTGALSVTELFDNVPDITSNFNNLPHSATGDWGTSAVRPNIRNIANNGGNTTLLLLDGHQMVGSGVLDTTPDQEVIAPDALQRVDVDPDGGSSLYGSDAIGGVINLITRQKFDGFQASAHAGYAANYSTYEGSAIVGKIWDTGSAYLSFDYRRNSDLLAGDRSYASQFQPTKGGNDYRSLNCSPGNAIISGQDYSLATGVQGKQVCDSGVNADLYPAEHQVSLFGRWDEKLSDTVSFYVTGYYADRADIFKQNQDAVAGGEKITSANPFFNGFGTGATSESLSYNYASAFGLSADDSVLTTETGITPTITVKLPNDWRLVAFYNYGYSYTVAQSPRINATAEANALASTSTATALDPYNLALTNPLVLQQIHAFEQYGAVGQTMHDAKATGDGPIFHLPGGEVRLAVGGEVEYYAVNAVGTGGTPDGDLSTALYRNVNRSIAAGFGEVVAPLVGPDNAMPGVRALTADVSVRYDHYSDFGGTTNYKLGVSYKPIDDLTIRGNYGTAFNAPSLTDMSGSVDTRIQVGGNPVTSGPAAFGPYPQSGYSLTFAGGNPNLVPQTATTYSVGADYKPAFIPGLSLSTTYWDVYLQHAILVYGGASLYANPQALAALYIHSPTLAQVQAKAGNVPVVGAPSLAALYSSGLPVFQFQDLRRANLGSVVVNGLDFNGAYNFASPVGHLTLSMTGTLTLASLNSVLGGSYFSNLAANLSPYEFNASLEDRVGDFSGRVWVNYSAGFNITGAGSQTSVGAFDPINMAFMYNLHGRWLENTTLSLNIDNVANINPPFENIAAGYPAPGSVTSTGTGFFTLGREVEFGIRKKF